MYMYYYEVYVADGSYKGTAALTYQHDKKLLPGRLATVPLKRKTVYGVVVRQVPRPSFTARPLAPAPLADGVLMPRPLIELAAWITTYYPSGIGTVMQQLMPHKYYTDVELTKLPEIGKLSGQPELNSEQQSVVDSIQQPDTYILHGETGSGKTRVYIELAQRNLEAGRSSIILTPEIGLTPQLAQNFQAAFGTKRVLLTHSQLTAKARSLLWHQALQAKGPLVVIGPRSALFLPLQNVGLIVLDESHESSYKQEQAPHYHASKVAAKLASLHQASLILGSATPAITDYYLAQAKGKPVLRMESTAKAVSAGQPDTTISTTIVNLTDRQSFKRAAHLSDKLIDSIQNSLNHSEQSLVFLNRRGTARVILCQQCGWQAACPHCDLPLTYHGDSHNIRCHTCGYTDSTPTSCPVCSSTNIILKSIGTKAIVDELTSIFPHARIQRFDTDNARDERLESHYDDIRDGKIDIIVGTQLIAKGLDLPKLSTVGVVVADTSLYLPDYSSAERSYQLLRQVVGRVGRGHRSGRVVIQSYDPENPVIKAAATGDWTTFYANELTERQAFMFPPFVYTLKIICRRASVKSAQLAAEKAIRELRQSGLRIIIDGPMPAFHEKAAGKYQWQANIKAKDRNELVKAISLLPANWSYDIDPSNLL